MGARLNRSLSRYGLVQNLVVRPVDGGAYELLAGSQRLNALKASGATEAPCVVLDLDDGDARLLSQALNRVHGEDDLGLRAELVRQVLELMPREEVLGLLPETAQGLDALAALGQQDMADYLQTWQKAQAARLKHLQFQLTVSQLEVVEPALEALIPEARTSRGDSPNARGTALYLLCRRHLEQSGDLS